MLRKPPSFKPLSSSSGNKGDKETVLKMLWSVQLLFVCDSLQTHRDCNYSRAAAAQDCTYVSTCIVQNLNSALNNQELRVIET